MRLSTRRYLIALVPVDADPIDDLAAPVDLLQARAARPVERHRPVRGGRR
jgi:hypothetical protein